MTVAQEEIARYAAEVRAALVDLPPTVRDELLEDLPEHLAEVAAEGEGSLVARLGPPEVYAFELRTAAGVAPPAPVVNLDRRIGNAVRKGRDRLREVDTRVGPVIGYTRLSDFLRLLRPAWWVLRGYLAAMLVTVVLTGHEFGLLPRLGGSGLGGLLLLGLAVIGSIWLGRRSDRMGAKPRLVLNVAAVVLVLFGLIGFLEADGRAVGGYSGYQQVYTDQYSGVQDVYVYDSEGRLLEGVRLFDQNGEPIRLGSPWCAEAREQLVPGPEYVDPMQQPYPFCPEQAPFRLHPAEPPTTPAVGAPTVTPTSRAPTPTPTPTPTN